VITGLSFVGVGVGPRTVGRLHSERVGLLAAPVLVWLGRVLGPLTRLLVLVGNALTPAAASGTARSTPRRSCATWSTSPARRR
jgi:CBS domain containing-hemolysin-like protein